MTREPDSTVGDGLRSDLRMNDDGWHDVISRHFGTIFSAHALIGTESLEAFHFIYDFLRFSHSQFRVILTDKNKICRKK